MPFRASAAVIAVALGVAGCGGGDDDAHKIEKVSMSGSQVKDPGKLLADAKTQFLSTNQAAIDSKSASVSDSTSCFFRRESAKSDAVMPKVFCGPIRRAGSDTAHVWDVYGAYPVGTDDPAVLATGSAPDVMLSDLEQQGTTVDNGLLVRPDGGSPADAAKLAEPQAPQSKLRDYAALLPESQQQSGFTFKNLSAPARLVTPSATITVQAEAQPTTVPAFVENPAPSDAATDDDYSGDDDATDGTEQDTPAQPSAPAVPSRAADGQQLRAYRVTVEPGGRYPDPNASEGSSWGPSNEGVKNASTALSISVGGQRLSVHGDPIGESDSYSSDSTPQDTVTVQCKSLPCAKGAERQSYVLFVSSAKGQAASLTATVDGQALTLPLSGGKPDGSVSLVGNTRTNLQQQTNVTWPSQEIAVTFDNEYDWLNKKTTVNGGVPVVFLSPFDNRAGWAPKGQAWLEVPVTSQSDWDSDFAIAGSAYWLEVGGQKITSEGNAGADGTVVFKVPEGFTTGTVKYQPAGSVKGNSRDGDSLTKPFKLATPMTVPISIPAG
ncbi:hypothetical protein VV01_19790 [Luteipulveratus halotolerans]|uniref:Lipoprotein n=2 Tax=Luteipulveratus halotolerans TaxID=1631356 RepID=A0A0L6CMU2_9MICO|nr:hypothetical protein VV01_19790 [Luteipulveratus halotolerans]